MLTIRQFDPRNLTTLKPFSPEDVIALRQREHVSQAVLARYLNVGISLVSKWERGEKTPRGPALKLLVLARNKGLKAIA
jgi:putative transcriptional regulator